MSRRRLSILVVALLAGCTASPTVKPSPPSKVMRLVAFDSCDQLTKDLRAAAKTSVGPYGFSGGGVNPEIVSFSAGARAPVPATPDHSSTNVHEAGADEPDMVKTDGRRIVTVDHDGVLRVVDAASRQVTGRLALGAEYGVSNLLLAGDHALVLRSARWFYRGWGGPRDPGPDILLIDLTGAPRLTGSYQADARLVDARLTGGVARVVLASSPRITFPDLPNVTDEDKRVAANQKAIGGTSADAWLPTWTVTNGSTKHTGKLDCSKISRPATYSGASMLSILTFDLGAGRLTDGDPVALVADGDTVYGTGTSLYVANDQRWRLDRWPGRSNRAVTQETEIYRFDTPDASPPAYSAAGTVPGVLINQYAMSEWDGHLRVATTDSSTDRSAVRVLRPEGDRLVQVGEVDGLGKGEQIYSVRFIGPRGYVVTFRQTDPLYSVDLSDPTKPVVSGELKITGYSAHLQPAGDGRLIGIGQEANTRGRTQGTQVSLFDVSDSAAPRRLAQHIAPGEYSEAEWDPHALLWWPATSLLVVPLSDRALAFRATDRGLTPAGQIRQPTTNGYTPTIRRSMVIGDVLWTLSDSGIQASSLSTLDRVSWLPTGG
jgi:uncharacterized secreted protein with C-terminal beta-propeller domain